MIYSLLFDPKNTYMYRNRCVFRWFKRFNVINYFLMRKLHYQIPMTMYKLQLWFVVLIMSLAVSPQILAQKTIIQGADRFGFVIKEQTYQHEFLATTVQIVTQPSHGNVQIATSGMLKTLNYQPDSDYKGNDMLLLKVTETSPGNPVAFYRYQLSIEDNHVLPADDFVSADAGTTITLNVLDNDIQLLDNGNLSIQRILSASAGTATVEGNTIKFVPTETKAGFAHISYRACDLISQRCGTGWAKIRYDLPTAANAMSFTMIEGASTNVHIPKGYTLQTAPLHGQFDALNEYAFDYKPNLGFSGQDEAIFVKNGINTALTVSFSVINTSATNQYAKEDYAWVRPNEQAILSPLCNDLGQFQINAFLQAADGQAALNQDNTQFSFAALSTEESQVAIPYQIIPLGLTPSSNVILEWSNQYVKLTNGFQKEADYQFEVYAGQATIIPLRSRLQNYAFTIINNNNGNKLKWYGGLNTVDINGQSYTGSDFFVYTPDQLSGFDHVSFSYCVGTECKASTMHFDILPANEGVNQLPGDVWPGDFNADGQVAINDALSLVTLFGQGQENNTEASPIFWGCESSLTGTLPDGTAAKNADANADGFIDLDDVNFITSNRNKFHAVSTLGYQFQKDLPIALISNGQPIKNGDTVSLKVQVGSLSNPVTNFAGVAFKLAFNEGTIVPGSMQFIPADNGFFGSQPTFSISNSGQTFDVATTSIRRIGATGNGEVGEIRFIVDDIIDGFKNGEELALEIHMQEVTHSNASGMLFSSDNNLTSLPIDPSALTNLSETNQINAVVWPNPTSRYFHVHVVGLHEIRDWQLVDVLGREIKGLIVSKNNDDLLFIHELPEGLYTLRLFTDSDQTAIPILVR
jgi:hypothetical protein